MICYETERLQVRHLTAADLDDLAILCADPTAMRYMGDGNPLTREQCAQWIDICQSKYQERGYGTSGVFEQTNGVFVGICGVVRPPEQDFDEIIYALLPSYWGKGYATEVARGMLRYVFQTFDLDAIYATVHADNAASINMMSKLGMRFVEERIENDDEITKVYVLRQSGEKSKL